MSNALEVAVAEFRLQDFTDKQFKKLEKNISKSIKGFIDAEKQVKKTDGVLTRFGKGFKSKVTAGGKIAKTGIGGLSGGFGGLSNAATSIPILGAGIAAGLVAINSVRQRFQSEIALKKELLTFSNDFRAAFKNESDNVLKSFSRDGFFRKEDVEATLTGLTDLGVSPEAIRKNAETLQAFAKSQGFTDIGQAISALSGGQVKSGRGIGTSDILQIQSISELLSNVATADQGFQLLTDILKRNRVEIDKFADQTVANLSEVNNQQKKILDTEQALTLAGTEGGESLYNVATRRKPHQQNIISALAKGADATIQGVGKAFGVTPGKPDAPRAPGQSQTEANYNQYLKGLGIPESELKSSGKTIIQKIILILPPPPGKLGKN